MADYDFNSMQSFIAVAKAKSFTKAAAQLGVSQSALSHSIRTLESKLGVRLLTRTTRSVSLTEGGEQLLRVLDSRFQEIETELAAIRDARDQPAGSFRITCAEHAANTVLWPKLSKFLPSYPDINVEIVVDYGLRNIVEHRYDAGVRLGDQVEKDMIAVRISPDLRMAAVATPAYFAAHGLPNHPKELAGHNCINLRLPTHGNLYAWEFEKDGQQLNVHVRGQLTFNSSMPIRRAALAGMGIAFIPEDMVLPHINDGSLERVLEDWCPYFPGYHLYYPSRRQSLKAFALMIDALRL